MTCTVRATADTPHYCAKSRQSCATPYTCSAACRLGQTSSTPPAAAPTVSNARHLVRWMTLTAAMYGAVYLITGLTPF